jgi:hypothetical protein
MRKLISLGTLFLMLLGVSYGQEKECKVLMEEISDSYQGDCKNGLAHGKGIASGVDVYQGKFKKGFPWGSGKYIWANGDYYEGRWKEGKKHGKGVLYTKESDTKLKGIWKQDKFVREIKDPAYEVILKSGVTGLNFYKDNENEPYDIEVVFQKDGNQSRIVRQLLLSSTSGRIKKTSSFSGFEDVHFPFEGAIEFVDRSRMGTMDVRYEVKFKIIEEGSWRILIRY